MSFFKKLHHLSSGGASVDEFTMQKLLYPSVPSKEALQGIQPSFSSVETASSRPFPRSTLIKELLDVTISALHNIGPYKEKKSEYVGMVMDRSATSLETKISLWGLDLSEIEKILKHAENLGSCGPQNEELYAGIFKGLAEMVFLACT